SIVDERIVWVGRGGVPIVFGERTGCPGELETGILLEVLRIGLARRLDIIGNLEGLLGDPGKLQPGE
ncbi:MAG TPA: hypothetical protein VIY29_00425, partial [Ktedonobacteraceae bacterium]